MLGGRRRAMKIGRRHSRQIKWQINPILDHPHIDAFARGIDGAIYLTTVGYGTGALLGRGVKQVRELHWKKELGLAQAMWVIEVENFGPFIVESDVAGNSLFERENAKIAANIEAAYEGTKPAVLKRFGETDDRKDEMI